MSMQCKRREKGPQYTDRKACNRCKESWQQWVTVFAIWWFIYNKNGMWNGFRSLKMKWSSTRRFVFFFYCNVMHHTQSTCLRLWYNVEPRVCLYNIFGWIHTSKVCKCSNTFFFQTAFGNMHTKAVHFRQQTMQQEIPFACLYWSDWVCLSDHCQWVYPHKSHWGTPAEHDKVEWTAVKGK